MWISVQTAVPVSTEFANDGRWPIIHKDFMNCYATLFVNWLIADNGHFEQILKRGLWPEIGLQHGGFDWPPARHKETAAQIRDQGLRCSIHLPFYGVRTGSADPVRWRQSQDILMRALDICSFYEPDHLIGHPEFQPGLDSLNQVHAAGVERLNQNKPSEAWLERSALGWGEVLRNSPARLYLENTSDLSPEALMALLALLPSQAALCFDVGHWYYAAEGFVRQNLPQWLEAVAPRLQHLHLHDNDGSSDQHRGIGLGGIDFNAFLSFLGGHGLSPTFTLEAHHISDLDQSRNWLAKLSPESPLSGLDD